MYKPLFASLYIHCMNDNDPLLHQRGTFSHGPDSSMGHNGKTFISSLEHLEYTCSLVEKWEFSGKLALGYNRCFIVLHGRLDLPKHISAGCSDYTLGQNFL